MDIKYTILTIVVIAFSISLLWNKTIENDNLKKQIEQLKANNATNNKAIQTMREQLNKANAEITFRKEQLNEILKNHSDWCDTELPFDFDSMYKTRKDSVPSTTNIAK